MKTAIVIILCVILSIAGIIVHSKIDDVRQLAAWHGSCNDFRKKIIESGRDYLVGGWKDGEFVIRCPNSGEIKGIE